MPLLMLIEIEYTWWMAMLALSLLSSQFHIFQKKTKSIVCISKMPSLLLIQLVQQKTLHVLYGQNLRSNSVCLIIPVWELIRPSCLSILTANIIFAKVFSLHNFVKPPVFICFWFWAGWIICQWVFIII